MGKGEEMKKVYIAGALNSDAVGYIKNMNTMLVHADVVRRAGFAVYVPCLDFVMGLLSGDYQYHDYFNNSQPFLLSCDAVYVCPHSENSKGTQSEIETAIKNNIPVVWNVDELRVI